MLLMANTDKIDDNKSFLTCRLCTLERRKTKTDYLIFHSSIKICLLLLLLLITWY